MLIMRRRIERVRGTVALSLALSSVGIAGAPVAVDAVPDTPATSRFEAVAPIRLADTRRATCGCTRIDEHTIRVVVAGRDGVAGNISSAALTVTAAGAPAASADHPA